MTSSIPSTRNPRFSSITFNDNSILTSINNINNDVHIRKKLRVDNDVVCKKNLIVEGNLSITGDTNIVLQNYVTEQELTTAITNYETNVDKSRYLLTYAPNTLNSNAHPITGLSNNSSLLINTTNKLLIKNGAANGKYLKCINAEGETAWADIGSTTTTITDVTTQLGPVTNPSSQYSFKIVDIGVSGNSTERGIYFYPNILSEYITNAGTSWQQQSIVLAIGSGNKNYVQTDDNNLPRIFICPFGKGAEALFFKPPKSDDQSSGQTRLSGGAPQETDQFISLEQSGVKIKIKNETNATNKLLSSSSSDGLLSYVDTPLVKGIKNSFLPSSSLIGFESNGNILILPSNNTEAEARQSGNILSIVNGRTKWVTPTQVSLPAELFIPIHVNIPTDSKNQGTFRSISNLVSITAGIYLINFNICIKPNGSRRFELIKAFISNTFDGNDQTKLGGTKETIYGFIGATLNDTNPDFLNISNNYVINIITHGQTHSFGNNVHALPPGETQLNLYLNIFVRTSNSSSKEYSIEGDYSHFTLTRIK